MTSRSLSKLGRGHGESFRNNDSVEKSTKTEGRQKSSFSKVRRNVNFDPK